MTDESTPTDDEPQAGQPDDLQANSDSYDGNASNDGDASSDSNASDASDASSDGNDSSDSDASDASNEAGDSALPPPPRVAMGPGGAVAVAGPADERNWFQKIPVRLRIIGLGVIVIGAIGYVSSLGETNAEDLKPGDCFQEPDGDEIRSVEDQDCEGLHEAEILLTLQMPAGSAWPGGIGAFDAHTAVENECFAHLANLSLHDEHIPADAVLGYFFTDRSDWNDGDREVHCYVSSASGLTGRVVPTE